MRAVPIGITLQDSFATTADQTADAAGNEGVEVISSVALILRIEEACYHLIAPYYELGDLTVGTRFALDHAGPAFPGRPIDVHVAVDKVEGQRVTFGVTVAQDGREVMRGDHQRAFVDAEQFGGGTPKTARRLPAVEFWFDFHSPWCYLASMRIGGIARVHGAPLRWRPVHLPRLNAAIGGRRPLQENPAFVAWYLQDLEDHAALMGLPLHQHPQYPLRQSRALRATIYAEEQCVAEAFVQAVMRGYWSEERDISDLDYLQTVADAVKLEPRPVAEVAADPAHKQTIEDNLAEAVASGLFGVPTAVFDGKLFFGNDHLDLLDRHLAAWPTVKACS